MVLDNGHGKYTPRAKDQPMKTFQISTIKIPRHKNLSYQVARHQQHPN